LLVAGAAAGVAAIFKAPATGAIFALEVPFRDQMARRMLLPALVASASGYLVFVALSDTDPIFSFQTDRSCVVPVPRPVRRTPDRHHLRDRRARFSRLIRMAKVFTYRPLPRESCWGVSRWSSCS
jgi:chloride channel protein, CIC family